MTSNSGYTNFFETKIRVFDFDGVIIDSAEVKIDEYRNLFFQFTKNETTLNEIINIYTNSKILFEKPLNMPTKRQRECPAQEQTCTRTHYLHY